MLRGDFILNSEVYDYLRDEEFSDEALALVEEVLELIESSDDPSTFEDQIEQKENCKELASLADTEPNDANIKPLVDELRTKTTADREWSISVRRDPINGELVDSTFPTEGIQEGISNVESEVRLGDRFIGSIHTHPIGTFGMFSWRDLNVLLSTYEETSTSFQEDVFIMIVNNDGSVYALQITDFGAFSNRIRLIDWAIAELNGEDPEDYFKDDFRDLYQTSGGDLEKAFLTAYGDSGITLSKATNTDLDSWETLTLDGSGEVSSTLCD